MPGRPGLFLCTDFLCLQTLFRLILCFFLYVQLENIQTFCQIFDLLTRAAILKNKINYFYSLELVCQMLTCQLHVSASNFFPFLYFFSQFFFLPSSDSCRKRPGWHGLSGFGGTQVAFDWRRAHGPRPRRESGTPRTSTHAHPPSVPCPWQ